MSLGQNSNPFANRKDVLNVFFLILIAIVIFYPLFYTEYLYTDDWVQLWQYKSGLHTLMAYGRYLADVLTNWLYYYINPATVHDIISVRLFSFIGWIVCIPLWYFIVKKIVTREQLPTLLIFFSVLYLICTPPFSIYVSWAACLELFIANTAGLISGYIVYSFIAYRNNRVGLTLIAIVTSILFGLISLFTYQNGFGCFLLPFLLHLLAKPKNLKIVFVGIAACLTIYVIYYFLLKYNLQVNSIDAGERTKISIDLFPKIRFFFGRALAISFHFTYLFNEKDLKGFIVYAIIFLTWAITDFYQNRNLPFIHRLKIFAITLFILVLIYLPPLIVKENYSSNRTLFALNMGVFFLVANTFLIVVKKYETRITLVAILSFLFVLNARNNFSQQFLHPVKTEYRQVRSFIERNYN